MNVSSVFSIVLPLPHTEQPFGLFLSGQSKEIGGLVGFTCDSVGGLVDKLVGGLVGKLVGGFVLITHS